MGLCKSSSEIGLFFLKKEPIALIQLADCKFYEFIILSIYLSSFTTDGLSLSFMVSRTLVRTALNPLRSQF
jgi:hypothetical protein